MPLTLNKRSINPTTTISFDPLIPIIQCFIGIVSHGVIFSFFFALSCSYYKMLCVFIFLEIKNRKHWSLIYCHWFACVYLILLFFEPVHDKNGEIKQNFLQFFTLFLNTIWKYHFSYIYSYYFFLRCSLNFMNTIVYFFLSYKTN